MEFVFDNPDYLYFLFVVPIYILLHFFFARYSQRRAILFANFKVLKRVSKKYSLNSHTSLLILRLFVIVCMIFVLSEGKVSFEAMGDTSNYVVAVDNSFSMDVGGEGITRLDLAKVVVEDFIYSLSFETKVALLSFSSVSAILYPLDYVDDNLDNIIREIKVNQDMGTNLGDSIYSSVNLLRGSFGSKRIILLTDGQSNSGSIIDTAVKYAKKESVQVYTMGILGDSGANVYHELNFTLNEGELKNIANYTGGKYFQIRSKEDYLNAFNEIREIKKQFIVMGLREPLLLLILFLLLVEFVFVKTIYKITP